jgi:dTMP kinase
MVVLGTRELSGRGVTAHDSASRAPGRGTAGVGRYVARTPVVRGLVVGVLGAFMGAGVVIGTARFYADSLGGGEATFAVLFAALFGGFGAGIVAGPRVVGALSRRRWFGLSIVLAGVGVAALGLMPEPVGASAGAAVVGAGAGMAFLAGITLIGGEVVDEMRGRVFAFLQTAARLVLMVTIAVASVLVGFGRPRTVRLGDVVVLVSTTRLLLLAAGATGIAVGLAALRQMDDRPGVPVLRDVWRSLRRAQP